MSMPILKLGNCKSGAKKILNMYKLFRLKKLDTDNFFIEEKKVKQLRKDCDLPEIEIATFANYEIPEKFYEFIFPHLPEFFDISKISRMGFIVTYGNGAIDVHCDQRRSTCINYYLSKNDSITNFFKEAKSTAMQLTGTGEQTSQHTFVHSFPDESVLEPDISFTPEVGDMYLLDVSKPHSVTNITEDEKRCVLSIDMPDEYFAEHYTKATSE